MSEALDAQIPMNLSTEKKMKLYFGDEHKNWVFLLKKKLEKKVIITSVKKNQNSKKMKNIETWYKKLLSTLKKIIFVKNVI